jgi:hypothetical protein
VESYPIYDDEPTMPREEPPQREARRWRNQRRNVRRHHEAGERDPAQPVSRDEILEVGETPDERVFKERRNSRLEGVNRRNLKFTNLNTHYKPGLALELNSSLKERDNKSTKK